MFDSHPSECRDATLAAVRRFFVENGHELANAASLLGGAAAEAKVVSCGLYLDTAGGIDDHIRDLTTIHRLLALEDVGDVDRIETELFAMIEPASREVETICILTDKMAELLRAINEVVAHHSDGAGKGNRTLAA